MSILLENQLHCPTGPLARFFSSLDIHERGSLMLSDIHHFADVFCTLHRLSFVQKKILMMMITTGFRKYVLSSLSFSDLLVYAPRILLILSPHSTTAQDCQEGALLRHHLLSSGKTHITHHELSTHILSYIPNMMPNRKILSQFLVHIIQTLCSYHPHCGEGVISKEAWSDTALALFFEREQLS